MRAVAVEEIGMDPGIVLAIGAEPMPGVNAGFAEACPHRLMDHGLQAAAMDGELRHVITRVGATRLTPDLLAEAVGVEQLVGADGDLVEPLQQAKLRQFLDGMRQRIDADAELADRLRLLVNFALDAAGMQHQRRRETADPPSDDDRFHAANPTVAPPALAGLWDHSPSWRACAQRHATDRVSGQAAAGFGRLEHISAG